MALGARRSHIVWTVSRTTLSTICCGIAAGLAINLALRKLFEHWMPGGDSALWVFAPVTAIVFAGAALACLVPATRAAHADPMEALRCD
jgi:ABC-type lipoprotein release transport system permease subunit